MKKLREWKVVPTGYGCEVDMRDYPHDLSDPIDIKEGQSLAALIAAAPDLLAVLEEVVLQYETGILNQATIDDLVKYVIDKAKGGVR